MPVPLAALLPIVAALAPDLIRALAGDKAGAVAGRVAEAVTSVAGSTNDADVRLALADPARAADLRLELARIAAEAEREERAAELDQMRAVLADTANARSHTATLAQAGSRIAWMPVYKSVTLDGVFFLLLVAVVSGWTGVVEMPANLRDILTLLVGVIVREWSASNGYWLGTSRGAVEMRQGLQAEVRALTPQPTTADLNDASLARARAGR
jgi:hypothetical protein